MCSSHLLLGYLQRQGLGACCLVPTCRTCLLPLACVAVGDVALLGAKELPNDRGEHKAPQRQLACTAMRGSSRILQCFEYQSTRQQRTLEAQTDRLQTSRDPWNARPFTAAFCKVSHCCSCRYFDCSNFFTLVRPPLVQEEYMMQLDAVAEYLTEWGVVERCVAAARLLIGVLD